jgi:DNA-binding response OmpR family regulator
LENAKKENQEDIKIHRKKYTLLLIEDNEDFRFYLKDNLSVYYNIAEASNGKEGWEKAIRTNPDLIVSDIMMPVLPGQRGGLEMNGIELSKRLKKDPRTAQIPIILLTARASEEQKLEGYETGANDYIVKPFNFEILLVRIRNLLSEKKSQRRSEPPRVDISPAETTASSQNDKFIKDATEIVEKNIDDPDFSVDHLSHDLFMSRVTLYKKIVSITGKTPIEFIRIIRLKRAAQLLEKGMNVSQTAYEVGFNNPKYFTKYFKEEFGMLPSEYGGKDKG